MTNGGHDWVLEPGMAFDSIRCPNSLGAMRGDFKVYVCRRCRVLCVPIMGDRRLTRARNRPSGPTEA